MTIQTTQSTIGRRLLLGAVVLSVVVGLLVAPGAVAAQEDDGGIAPVPASYYGTLTVDGDPAPAGVEITAELEGSTYGSITTDGDGNFGGPTAGAEKLVVDPDSTPDDAEVTFLVEGEAVDTTVSWEEGDNQQVDLSIDDLPDSVDDDDSDDDNSDDDDSDDSSGSSGGGGGQAGGGQPASDTDEQEESEQEETETDSNTPSVEDVRSELEQNEPDTDTSTEIVDSDPDNPGVTVSPEGTESVRQITFGDEGATGSVEVREYQSPPESVSESVSAAVDGDDDDGTADDSDGTQTTSSTSVVSVADISPTDDTTASSAATVTITVDRDRLTDPQNAFIAHERDNSWEQLETSVQDSEDGEVTLEANVESFSLFAVAETTESTQSDTTDSDAEADETDDTDSTAEETGDSIPGFGFVAALAALLAGALIAYRR